MYLDHLVIAQQKTIKQEINQVDKKCLLYSRPRKEQKEEFKFRSIPAEDTHYASSCSKKSINLRLSQLRIYKRICKRVETGTILSETKDKKMIKYYKPSKTSKIS